MSVAEAVRKTYEPVIGLESRRESFWPDLGAAVPAPVNRINRQPGRGAAWEWRARRQRAVRATKLNGGEFEALRSLQS